MATDIITIPWKEAFQRFKANNLTVEYTGINLFMIFGTEGSFLPSCILQLTKLTCSAGLVWDTVDEMAESLLSPRSSATVQQEQMRKFHLHETLRLQYIKDLIKTWERRDRAKQ